MGVLVMGKIKLHEILHLSMRTGLGSRWNELKKYNSLSKNKSIQHIVYSASPRWTLSYPKLMPWIPWDQRQSSRKRRQLTLRLSRDKTILRQWLVKTMLRTPYPLTERMVLFWHNHFTTSMDKVNQPSLLLKQNILFRRHGLGNFKQLLHEVSRDPALLIYLDNQNSQRGNPNENFARELLELFTLGEGHFSERDVLGAAQAFTGWGVDRVTKRFMFRRDLHDNSVKYFMGKKGRFNGNHIIDMLLKSPYTAEHIAQQFWAEFISDEKPNAQTIKRWGYVFRHANYDIRSLLMAVLKSPEFWSRYHRGEKIKSPVELIVGTLRSLVIKPPSTLQIVTRCDALGQSILNPETPKGYAGGKAWIDTYTLSLRTQIMSDLVNNASVRDFKRMPNLPLKDKANWLLARKSVNPLPLILATQKEKLHHVLTDPAYQLI